MDLDTLLNELDAPKKRVIEALILSKGIITPACEAAQVPRSTFYHWMKNDETFKAAVEDVQEVAIDFVEGILYILIESRDTTAVIFYLKTRAKKRGYVERQEIAGVPDQPLVWQETKTFLGDSKE